MVELRPSSPAEGLLPLTIGTVSLREVVPDRVVSVLPFACATTEALEAALGLPFPAPGQTGVRDGLRAIWVGQAEALLIGAPVPDALQDHAAMVDQTDMWCFIELAGDAVEAVLARLVPVDLRTSAFPVGATTRTLLGHIGASVTRTDDTTFEIAVFRSMARTLVHEVQAALEAVAARG